jgi:hypothetical protein
MITLLSPFVVLSCLSRLPWSAATWTHGTLSVAKNRAVFISKFCFDYDADGNHSGEVDFRVTTVSPTSGTMRVILLDDQADSYPNSMSRWPGYDCTDQRLETAAKTQLFFDANQLVGTGRLHTFIVERIRPRWWFLAIVDCDGMDHELKYSLHMTNTKAGWMEELSLDRCGLGTYVFVCLIYLGIGIVQIKAVVMQSSARTKHPLRLILCFGINAALWSTGLYALDTLWYAWHGKNMYGVYFTAKCCKALSKFSLMFILMLLSRGRCISADLLLKDLWQNTMLVAPFLVLCLMFEIAGESGEAAKYNTGFVYGTWIGGVLVFFDMVLLGIYAYNLKNSYAAEADPDKKNFYRKWGCVYSTSFFALPAATILAFFVAPWVRERVMFRVTNMIHATLLALLVAGLYPERTQTAFCIDESPQLASTYGLCTDNMMASEDYHLQEMRGS